MTTTIQQLHTATAQRLASRGKGCAIRTRESQNRSAAKMVLGSYFSNSLRS